MSKAFIVIKNNIRIYAQDLKDLSNDIIKAQKTMGLTSLVLASAISVFSSLSIMNKEGEVHVSYSPINAMIKKIIIEGNSKGEIRALIDNKKIITEYDGDINKLNSVPLQLVNGNEGTLKIINIKKENPFGGEVKIVKGDFVTDLAYYFNQSAQIKSAVLSDVALLSKNKIKKSLSVIFQLLPKHTEKDIKWIEAFVKNNKLSNFKNINEIISKIDGKVLETKVFTYKCKCSKEKMKAIVDALSENEKKSIIKEIGFIEIKCEFCNNKFQF